MKKIIVFIICMFLGTQYILSAQVSDYYNSSDLSDYFGTMKACTKDGSDSDCRNGNEYKFYLKMYDIYYLYKNKYKITLDLSLIMSTLYYNNEQLPTVFSSNLNNYDRSSLKNTSIVTNLDWEYDFKNDPCYTYLNANDNSYDMQILAKNMVKKTTKYKCKTDNDEESKKEYTVEDIEKSNYSTETLKCENGEYDKDSITETYEKDEEKYKNFLSEYIKLKYHTPGSEVKSCSNNKIFNDGDYTSDIEFLTGNFSPIHYYNQGDYSQSYGGIDGATIATHGCGPTSLSIVISSITGIDHDPVEITNYVCDHGGCTEGGTSWGSITSTAIDYGLKAEETDDNQTVVNALASGNSLAIALMCPGHFTSGGHFIVLTGVSSNGKVTVADPASRDRSTEWDFNVIAEESCNSRKYWIIKPGDNMNVANGNSKQGEKRIIGVPKINQNNEGLPTGCETVSAVMLMNFYLNNKSISSEDFANKYLIKKSYNSESGPDPNSAFVGSPFKSQNSFGIYAPAMTKSMNNYLSGYGLKAVDISGNSLSSILANYSDRGKPVMMGAAIGMKSISKGASWKINYTDENAKYKKGDIFTWLRPEHCLVLVGYDNDYYYFNDPNTGREEKYEKSAVEKAYNGLGKQAIIIK